MRDLKFILTTNAGTFTLDRSPDGWDDTMINWARSDRYWGVSRSWTVPLKFIKEGALQLRFEFYLRGTAASASIVIQKYNRLTFVYETAYAGKLDFGTFIDSENDVTVNFIDSGIAKAIKDKGGDEYQITADDIILSAFHYGSPVADTYTCTDFYTLAFALIDKITDGQLTSGAIEFQSDLLDYYSNQAAALLGGDHADHIFLLSTGYYFMYPNSSPADGRFITTLNDLFQAMWFLNPGMGIELNPLNGKEVVRIEAKDHFFDSLSDIIDCGNVSTLSISVDQKLSAKKIKVGWPSKEYTNAIIPQEPNASSEWSTPNTTAGSDLDMVSKFRADSSGIQEIITTLSDSANEDIFILVCSFSGSPGFEVNVWSMDTLAKQTGGVGEWYIGNGLLTPRKILQNNASFLNSIMWNYIGRKLTFNSGDNDLYNIEIKLPEGSYVAERADITLGDPVYFIPVIFEIEAAFPIDLINQLNENAVRKLQFTYKDDTYTGWVMDVKVKLYGRSSMKVKLLSCWGNTLVNLIR